jgi:hypothetical protein
MRTFCAGLAIALLAVPAVADPDPTPDPVPTFTLQTSLFDTPVPAPQVPSLRIEAARVAAERFQDTWRYPEPGELGGVDGAGWYFGNGHYRPRSRRATALHAGAGGATLLGEILLSTGSPLAGVGALAAGATLDAAAADVDNDTEAREQAPKKKKKKH